MATVRWTQQPWADLDSIGTYIARDSVRYAQAMMDRIFAAGEGVAEFPRAARVVPEINREHIREVFVGNYRVIYRSTGELVEILTIHHGAKLIDPKSVGRIQD